MGKVRLPKVTIDAIDDMKAKGCGLAEIVSRKISNNLYCVNNWQTVKELDTDTLIRALYIGYEVEETPEEVVWRIFDRRPGMPWSINADFRQDIIDILNAYDIKVEGVNA